MTRDEIFDAEDNTPVQLKDGLIGLLLIYPKESGEHAGMCGVQVHGEEYHRWIHHEKLKRCGRSLMEIE